MSKPERSWSRADDELERLAQFLWHTFPAERLSLEPLAVPRAKAIVNVTMKLLLRAFGEGGAFPVRYTISGKMRHYLAPVGNSDGETLTFCGHRAYTLAELVAIGTFNGREAGRMRHAETCGTCLRRQRSFVPITADDMADAGRRLAALAELLADAEVE